MITTPWPRMTNDDGFGCTGPACRASHEFSATDWARAHGTPYVACGRPNALAGYRGQARNLATIYAYIDRNGRHAFIAPFDLLGDRSPTGAAFAIRLPGGTVEMFYCAFWHEGRNECGLMTLDGAPDGWHADLAPRRTYFLDIVRTGAVNVGTN